MEFIQQLQSHRSIRKFKSDPVTNEQLERILLAAQAASTSSNIQAYSIIGVKDKERKKRFAKLAGNQNHIEQCPLFLVWCADLNRLQIACSQHASFELEQNVEAFLLATVDTSLAAQNAAAAAESLGLGIVYIGGIRNNPQEASELLKLPSLVYPVFGMCLGVPDHSPDLRPRLPLNAIYHQEEYESDKVPEGIQAYDEIMQHYYKSRSGGGRNTAWSEEMLSKFKEGNLRRHMYDFLVDQGFRFQ